MPRSVWTTYSNRKLGLSTSTARQSVLPVLADCWLLKEKEIATDISTLMKITLTSDRQTQLYWLIIGWLDVQLNLPVVQFVTKLLSPDAFCGLQNSPKLTSVGPKHFWSPMAYGYSCLSVCLSVMVLIDIHCFTICTLLSLSLCISVCLSVLSSACDTKMTYIYSVHMTSTNVLFSEMFVQVCLYHDYCCSHCIYW